jgi:hypothetical protein
VGALTLGGGHFAAGESPRLEDTLEAKCRLVVRLLRWLSLIRFSNIAICLF